MVNYRDRHLCDKQSIVHAAWQTEGCGYLTLTIKSSHKLQCGSSGVSLCWHLKTCVFISGREHNYYAGFWLHSKNVSFLYNYLATLSKYVKMTASQITNGSLSYSYLPSLSSDMKDVICTPLPGWVHNLSLYPRLANIGNDTGRQSSFTGVVSLVVDRPQTTHLKQRIAVHFFIFFISHVVTVYTHFHNVYTLWSGRKVF